MVHSGLGHAYKSLTCSYALPGMIQVRKAAGHRHGSSSPSLGHQPVAHAAMTPVPRLTPIEARLTPNILHATAISLVRPT